MKNHASPPVHLLLLSLTAISVIHAADYSVTDLGPGSASDVNDAGSVVGLDPQNGGWYYHGGAVEPLTNVVLGDIRSPQGDHDYIYSKAFASLRINNSGHIGGIASSPVVPVPISFLYAPDVGGGDTVIAVVSGYNDSAALNDNDLSPVSYYYNLVPPDNSTAVALVLAPSRVGAPSNLGWNYQVVRAINNSGVMAGSVAEGALTGSIVHSVYPHPARACVISLDHVLQYIDSRDPGTNYVWDMSVSDHLSDAYGINSLGHVVGDMSLGAPSAIKHPFLWRGGALEDLGTLGGLTGTALDINDFDRIVGTSTAADGSSKAFLWQNGTMTDLNSVLPANSGWVLVSANAINNNGQIVGDGMYNGEAHGFILSPPVLGYAPTITIPPVGAELAIHDSYQLSVSAVGSAPMSYRWTKDDAELPGQTNAVFSIANASAADAGKYRVVISNTAGSTTSVPVSIYVLDAKLGIAIGGDSALSLTINGEVGGHYRLEYASQPDGAGGWSPLTTLSLTNAVQVYGVPLTADSEERYYRGVRVP